eukprot:1112129-Amphidinium_carterae.1
MHAVTERVALVVGVQVRPFEHTNECATPKNSKLCGERGSTPIPPNPKPWTQGLEKQQPKYTKCIEKQAILGGTVLGRW